MDTVVAELEFWNLARPAAGGCLLWQGPVNDSGYGRCGSALTGEAYAHRAAWVLVNGPLPPDMLPTHTCHDRARCRRGENCPHRRCIEPGHLQLRPDPSPARVRRRVNGVAHGASDPVMTLMTSQDS
jgi:hypothetical protein